MEAVKVSGFVNAGNTLMVFRAPAAVTLGFPRGVNVDSIISEEGRKSTVNMLDPIRYDCEGLGLDVTLLQVNRLIAKIMNDNVTYRTLQTEADAIQTRLTDELDTKLYLAVDSQHAKYYTDYDVGWDSVIEKFPSTYFDIEESGKCLALNRYTASVFHLMRVAETGLQSIAKRVGLENDRPNWIEAIRYIEGQLNKNYDEMEAIFKGDVEFLSGIAAHMRSVNLAWRRRVSHIQRTYNQEEVKGIYDSTLGMMQHIANKLVEIED